MSEMKFFRQWSYSNKPEVSLILLDWNVRESFHVLEYLSHQRIRRDRFEVIWVEYYDHRSPELDGAIKKYESRGLPSPVDTWIIMGNPAEEVYHKHKMYNEGILAASAPVITIMDSDSVLRTDFVSTIIEEFKKRPQQVLHFEQIRNFDQSHYPFDYPTFETINGDGCVNAKNGIPHGFDGKPKSLRKDWNLWHIYNYGACFSARKEDIIRYGGADEHHDYRGHICGPYEMSARLVNTGIYDQLHPEHFTYHPWHPNTGGGADFCGPNNGKGMSLMAMKIAETGRAKPFKENPVIQNIRLEKHSRDDLFFV